MTNCGTDKKYFKKLLLIDLDGVLNLYNGKYDANKISKIRPGTLDFIKKLHQDYRISIFTARDIKTTIENYKYYNAAIEEVYIPETKHLPQLEAPDEMIEQINIFLCDK